MEETVNQLNILTLTRIRKKLHSNPEVSGAEAQTAQYIIEILESYAPDAIYKNLGGHGVMAVFGKPDSGLKLLFRAELDALPIQEINNFEHKSTRKGVSHKCGHDGHMAILLGLVERSTQESELRGQFLFLFQPAEETGEGAQKVLNENIIQAYEPDYCFALHNLPGYPLGNIIIKEGAFTASVKSLIIKLEGKTAHAAEPEFGINPAVAMAEIIQLAQRFHNPRPKQENFSLITPVHMILGEPAYGLSAGYGEVHLTIRTWSQKKMDEITRQLVQSIEHVASLHDLEISFDWTNEFIANKNDSYAVDLIEKAARKLNLPIIQRNIPLKWGEDFGAISNQCKGAMFGIGAGETQPALHNPDYDFPDDITTVGINMFKEIANCLLEENDKP